LNQRQIHLKRKENFDFNKTQGFRSVVQRVFEIAPINRSGSRRSKVLKVLYDFLTNRSALLKNEK